MAAGHNERSSGYGPVKSGDIGSEAREDRGKNLKMRGVSKLCAWHAANGVGCFQSSTSNVEIKISSSSVSPYTSPKSLKGFLVH